MPHFLPRSRTDLARQSKSFDLARQVKSADTERARASAGPFSRPRVARGRAFEGAAAQQRRQILRCRLAKTPNRLAVVARRGCDHFPTSRAGRVGLVVDVVGAAGLEAEVGPALLRDPRGLCFGY